MNPGSPPARFAHVLSFVPLAGLAAALVLVVILARQVEARGERVARLTERLNSLQRGNWLPTVALPTTDDSTVVVGERRDGGRQLLLVFTTTCEFCRASLPTWAGLPERLDSAVRANGGPDVQVLGLAVDSLGSARRYRATHRLPFVVAQLPEGKLRALFRARAVPAVVLLDSAGRVMYTRTGVLTAAAVDSVLAASTAPNVGAQRAASATVSSMP